jgi:uncharacterized protein
MMASWMRRSRAVVTVLLLALLLLPVLALADTPEIRQPVTDARGLLSDSQRESVAESLVRLRADTGVQMAVLLVGSTGGEPIEDYSHRVATAWKGGEAGRDNGLLLVVAVDDRRMRLEVGYGLEEYLPDDATRLLLDAQGPKMRVQDYTGALSSIIQGVRERLPAVGADGRVWKPLSARQVNDTFLWLMWTALAVGLLLSACLVPLREKLGVVLLLVTVPTLLFAPPSVARSFIQNDHPSVSLLLMGYGTLLLVFFLGGLLYWKAYKLVGSSLAAGTALGVWFATYLHRDSVHVPSLFLIAAALSLVLWGAVAFLMAMVSSGAFSPSASSYSSSDSSSSSYSSSDSSFSSYSSSDSSSSSSSSSSDSSWGGGGGDFGGGGSSSSW